MRHLNEYITEKLKINSKVKTHEFCPTTTQELEFLCEDLMNAGRFDLNCIDTSQIENMDCLFSNMNLDKVDISYWDVSNVKYMGGMFMHSVNFNSDLSRWDVSNVVDFESCFFGCTKLDFDVSNWDVSNANSMSEMFYKCESFTGKGLENWKIDKKKLKHNGDMFYGCDSLKNIPSWYIEI